VARSHQHARLQALLAVRMGGVADCAFFVAELFIEQERIVPLESGFHGCKSRSVGSTDDKRVTLLAGPLAVVIVGLLVSEIPGVPTIVLGEAVSAPLSSSSLGDIEAPRLAKFSQRLQWAADLAYCQWTIDEFRSGEAWPHLRKLLIA